MKKTQKIQDIIKAALKKKGFNFKTVSLALKIEENHFLNCLSGKTNLNSAEFLSLCIFLKLNLNDFKKIVS